MGKVCLVGIGNPFRGDDGVGWAVIDALEKKLLPSVDLYKQKGDFSQLVDLFSKYASVWIVDACQTLDQAGSWYCINALQEPLIKDVLHTSTHGFGVSQAIELAATLHQLPSQLMIYAIVGKKFEMNDTLSYDVAQAVPQVAEAIKKEILYA